MAHHRHFMQRWLSVENDDIVVSNVSLDLVTNLEVQIRGLGVVPQIDTVAGIPDNVLRPWILISSPPHQLLQIIDVERRNDFRVGQVGRNRARHPDLKMNYFPLIMSPVFFFDLRHIELTTGVVKSYVAYSLS